MSVDKDTVKRVARLARIAVSDAEAEALRGELNTILGFVEQLNEVDVTGVEPMTSVVADEDQDARRRGHRRRRSRQHRRQRARHGRTISSSCRRWSNDASRYAPSRLDPDSTASGLTQDRRADDRPHRRAERGAALDLTSQGAGRWRSRRTARQRRARGRDGCVRRMPADRRGQAHVHPAEFRGRDRRRILARSSGDAREGWRGWCSRPAIATLPRGASTSAAASPLRCRLESATRMFYEKVPAAAHDRPHRADHRRDPRRARRAILLRRRADASLPRGDGEGARPQRLYRRDAGEGAGDGRRVRSPHRRGRGAARSKACRSASRTCSPPRASTPRPAATSSTASSRPTN